MGVTVIQPYITPSISDCLEACINLINGYIYTYISRAHKKRVRAFNCTPLLPGRNKFIYAANNYLCCQKIYAVSYESAPTFHVNSAQDTV